jgi:hypothetical protein
LWESWLWVLGRSKYNKITKTNGHKKSAEITEFDFRAAFFQTEKQKARRLSFILLLV